MVGRDETLGSPWLPLAIRPRRYGRGGMDGWDGLGGMDGVVTSEKETLLGRMIRNETKMGLDLESVSKALTSSTILRLAGSHSWPGLTTSPRMAACKASLLPIK
jgi:hypothetical protein